MAYTRRKTSTKKTARRGSTARTRSTGRTSSRRTTRTSSRSSSRSAAPRTIRIVIEQPAATGPARPLTPVSEAAPPKVNKF